MQFLAFAIFVFVVCGLAAAYWGLFRIHTLAARVEKLERQASQAPRADSPAAPSTEVSDRGAAEPASLAEPPGGVPPSELGKPTGSVEGVDWEELIAGRWLNRIGIIAVLLAAAFFLKFAFDNDWIGPSGRVAIGLVAGAGLIGASHWLLQRSYRYFSEGIAALGLGVLYLSLFAAWDFYRLIPEGAAFAGMALVTASFAAIAWGRDSERLGVLALLGGLATPALLASGVDRQVALFSYLAVLTGVFLALAWFKKWRWIAPLAWLGVVIYQVGWHGDFFDPTKLGRTVFFATLFFLFFAGLGVASVLVRGRLAVEEMLLTISNAAWFGVYLHLVLTQDNKWALTLAVLALGAAHLVVARLIPAADKNPPDPTRQVAVASEAALSNTAVGARYLYAAIALGFITAAVPIRLEGDWIRIAWAVEGALLVWAGLKADIRALRLVGAALTAVAAVMLLESTAPANRFLVNVRFASFAVVAGALGAAYLWARKSPLVSKGERYVFEALGVSATVVGVWGLSEEVWRYLGRQQWDFETRLARQLGLSVLWIAVAALLIVVGIQRKSKSLRWQGLALLGLTVGKVFLVDLSFLERAYRIASFLALGIVLLAVSFLYQKSQKSDRRGPP